ncbi:nuclear transcription factor Y subunit B-3-like [Canna indica]|uniref:Nuclear transcription factor Y subunit B-3-like n=1 Tax=Canna indica TaxID=4628 RepID=A0AAQ3KR06_9LILI|nr:nuclear transcription factor Y subunit B-3-like [Canna indica]
MADSDNESGGHINSNAGLGAAGELSSPREQDRFLPIANVSRIMKKALPANAKISKDAKETVQECVSEFISFITGEASDKCQREKRKTINGDDLLWAMTTLGFEEYVEPLKVYLQRFREMEGEKGGGSSSSSQPQQKDGAGGGSAAAPAMSMDNNVGGFAGSAGGASAMYGGGMTMMMGQQMYGSQPSSSPYHHHHLAMTGRNSMAPGGDGGGNSSSSKPGFK